MTAPDPAARYHDGQYLACNPDWHVADSAWKAQQILALMRSQGLAPRTLCEVGCGAGAVVAELAQALGDAVACEGWDISPQAHALAAARSRSNLRFHLGDALAPGAPRADLVLAIDVMEHVEDYLGFLRRLAARGELKILHIPLDLSVQTVARGTPLARVRAVVGHLHYFTRDTALASLRHAGLEVLAHRYTAGSLDLPHRGWKANLLRLPRRLAFALAPDSAVRWLGGFSLLVLAR